MSDTDHYDNPLVTRYASREMSRIFSPGFKFSTWRHLWIELADVQRELGLRITKKQIQALKKHQHAIDFKLAEKLEKKFRHDVMAHIHTYAAKVPEAKGILHLGATSAFVGDNTDLIQMREGLLLLRRRLVGVIDKLGRFATKTRSIPTLGFTHFQPAQPTTVGKRACLWIQELLMDLEDLNHQLKHLKCRGAKGTTGTQASFLELFEGNHRKCEELDRRLAKRLGFPASYGVTGQTVSRKVDARILSVLSGIGQSAHRIANDLRLLAHLREVEEPFEKDQIGSSAMAYKRNPMRAERATSLGRFLINSVQNAAFTAATQWFERTLDDSANKRLSVPEAFLAADAVLLILDNVSGGLIVNRAVIEKHLQAELPFMATENILMAAVKHGGDRQELHEVIRSHSHASARRTKETGEPIDLISRLKADPAFSRLPLNWKGLLDGRRYVGRAPEQTTTFLRTEVAPALRPFRREIGAGTADLRV
ncbi:MAG: adenylosuccinate lyase [Planctomycetota bacterium]